MQANTAIHKIKSIYFFITQFLNIFMKLLMIYLFNNYYNIFVPLTIELLGNSCFLSYILPVFLQSWYSSNPTLPVNHILCLPIRHYIFCILTESTSFLTYRDHSSPLCYRMSVNAKVQLSHEKE